MSEKEIIVDFLLYYRTHDEVYEWAHQALALKIQDAAHLPLILALLKACENEEELAFVAGGPLEEAIGRHYHAIEHELDNLVQREALMQKAIKAVWLAEGSAARKMLDEILHKHGLMYP